MITLIASNIEYPQTDKGNIIRAQVYRVFADQIKEMYTKLEVSPKGGLQLEIPALEDYLMMTIRDTIGVPLKSPEIDFFTAGIDSLKAIQLRHILHKTLELNGKQLSTNVVYENRDAKHLARHLYALGNGEKVQQGDESSLMKQLINKYSEFPKHQYLNGVTDTDSNDCKPRGEAVVGNISSRSKNSLIEAQILTGATGTIGAHVLAQLVASNEIEEVFCLVRGANPTQRVVDSLQERDLELLETSWAKITALRADLSLPDFGLDPSTLTHMGKKISLIIHIAWPVNFNIHLQSFEPHIAGLYNLLRFSLSIHRCQPARLFFCSSISTALNTPRPASIPETSIEDLAHSSSMGYAQSKLVGEHIVGNAARAGAPSYVLRIGQIVGDTHTGTWNDKDFIPSMIRSALTLKVLPNLQEVTPPSLSPSLLQCCNIFGQACLTREKTRGS